VTIVPIECRLRAWQSIPRRGGPEAGARGAAEYGQVDRGWRDNPFAGSEARPRSRVAPDTNTDALRDLIGGL